MPRGVTHRAAMGNRASCRDARALRSILVAIAALVVPQTAEAHDVSGRTSSLAWVRAEGAETCIGGKMLAEGVETILGRSVFVSASAGDVAVEGQIARTPGADTWRATIRVSDDHGAVLGKRELDSTGADCRSIDESLAFVIAVMIDPDAATRAVQHVSSPPLAPSPTPAPGPAPAPSPTPAPDSTRGPDRWEIVPAVGWTGALGPLPTVAWGPTARLRVGRPILSFEAFGAFFLPQTESIPAGASVAFTAGLVGASACSTFAHAGTVGFLACAGVDLEIVNAEPSGLSAPAPHTDATGLAVAELRAEWRWRPPFFTALGLGADVPFSRTPYEYGAGTRANVQTLFVPAPVYGTANLSIGLFFR